MAIISFDAEATVDFIPAYSGNRDSSEQCVVSLKFVPYSRVQYYSRMISAQTKNISDPSKVTEITQGIQRRQFVDSVELVSGYYVGGAEIKDPALFYDTADTDLIIEVIKAMESAQRLSEGQVKN
jgi:hypothetical protein